MGVRGDGEAGVGERGDEGWRELMKRVGLGGGTGREVGCRQMEPEPVRRPLCSTIS